MFITKKKHKELLDAALKLRQESEAKLRKDYEAELTFVREQRDRAQTLFSILDKLADKLTLLSANWNDSTLSVGSSSVITTQTIGDCLPGNVAQFVPDYFGGQVIKQEATKVIEISAEGKVTEGLTKRHPVDNYDYILVRKEKV